MTEETTTTQNGFPEAPASATMKVKSPNGAEYLFTMRDEHASNLFFKMKTMEDKFMTSGFTFISSERKPAGSGFGGGAGSGFVKKAPLPGTPATCPICGGPAQEKHGLKKDGRTPWGGIFCSVDKDHTTWL